MLPARRACPPNGRRIEPSGHLCKLARDDRRIQWLLTSIVATAGQRTGRIALGSCCQSPAMTYQMADAAFSPPRAGYWRVARVGQPRASLDDSKATVIEVSGKLYVTLTSGKVQVAVFRVRNDGQLKRLVRIPPELKQEE